MAPSRASKKNDRTYKPTTAPTSIRRPAQTTTAIPRQANSSLTPQFHWNLNHSALKALDHEQLVTLYQLFRFYDSSASGDALPSINCLRLVELLRDAHLLIPTTTDTDLCVSSVERVYAQAVLGKLRTYLDADEQPALTFELFSGALLNCAMLKYPNVLPDEAFQQLLTRLFKWFQSTETSLGASARDGIILHSDVTTWSLNDSVDQQTQSPNYLDHATFQQVIASLAHDKVRNERLIGTLEQLYTIPDEIALSFSNQELLQCIVTRFRLFDVFDRGAIPRSELFTFLSGLVKRLEITDVYDVMNVILNGDAGQKANTGTQAPTLVCIQNADDVNSLNGPDVSLLQLLHGLHICRRSRSASYVIKSPSRISGKQKTTRGLGLQPDPFMSNETSITPEEGGSAQRKQKSNPKREAGSSHHKPHTRKDSHIRSDHIQKNLLQEEDVVSCRDSDKSSRLATSLPRVTNILRPSSRSGTPPDSVGGSERRSSMAKHNRGEIEKTLEIDIPRVTVEVGPTICIPTVTPVPLTPEGSTTKPEDERLNQETAKHLEPASSSSVFTSVRKVKDHILAVKMLHFQQSNTPNTPDDGAICYTATVQLTPPCSLTETHGIYFKTNGNRHEIWEEIQVAEAQQLRPEAVLRLLQMRIHQKEKEGYALYPEREQQILIQQLVARINKGQRPRYALALHDVEARLIIPSFEQNSANVVAYSTRKTVGKYSEHSNEKRNYVDHYRYKAQPEPPDQYKSLIKKWEVSRDDTWIHALNGASRQRQSLPLLAPLSLPKPYIR